MRWLLTICSIAVLAAVLTLGFFGHTDLLSTGLIGSIALLVAANLDRISEFKASASGVEARTREVVNRAEGAIAELRVLALHVAEVSLSLAMRQGRWGGFSDNDLDRLRKSVIENLQRLGISDEQSRLVLKDWHQIVEFDYAYHILGGSRIPDNASPEVRKQWDAMRQGGFERYSTPDELEQFLRSTNYLRPDLQELIEDYRFYIKERQHRRPEIWRNRENWGHLKQIPN